MNTTMQKLVLLGALFPLSLVDVCADVPSGQKAEVEHLISYLENSDCSMLRNGKEYDAEKGAKHIRRKYDHFRNEINSTEEFIQLSATRSTISGKPYEVQCPGEPPVESAAWLLEELEVYRGDQLSFRDAQAIQRSTAGSTLRRAAAISSPHS